LQIFDHLLIILTRRDRGNTERDNLNPTQLPLFLRKGVVQRRRDPLAKDIRGNCIILQRADGEFSILARLKPGSVRVSAGETAFRKQPAALCGNAGGTSEPRLHFQARKGQSFFFSPGSPIHFEEI
jgi:murein DD-endopeptidase MepM/ murein hydrolase activator NlpD